jgi:hypothetical protein
LFFLSKYPKVRIDGSPRRPQTLHQVQFLVFLPQLIVRTAAPSQ